MVLSVILVAGLWPFHSPKNQVRWLSADSGLQFGKYGTILSSAPFDDDMSKTGSAGSVKIWMQLHSADQAGTILAFYDPRSFGVSFALSQSLGDLVLRRGGHSHRHNVRGGRVYADDVLRGQSPVFLTMTSGPLGTSVYSNGGRGRKYDLQMTSSSLSDLGQIRLRFDRDGPFEL